MTKFIAVRRLSRLGAKVCIAGWLLLIVASCPIAPRWGWLALMAWGSMGCVILSPRVGLEIHTVRGMFRWCGLFIVWPLTRSVAERLFTEPSQWMAPPAQPIEMPRKI